MGQVGIRRVIRAVQRWGDTPELRVVHLGTAETDVLSATTSPTNPATTPAGITATTARPTDHATTHSHALSPELLAPIAGVTVEQYVAVSKGVAAYNYDQTKLPLVAAELGIDAAVWETAAAGFNARVSTSPAFARHFNALYRVAPARIVRESRAS